MFCAFSNKEMIANFFKFMRPQIVTTTSLSECQNCYAIEVNDHLHFTTEARIQLNDYDENSRDTLQQLVERFFNEPQVEEVGLYAKLWKTLVLQS